MIMYFQPDTDNVLRYIKNAYDLGREGNALPVTASTGLLGYKLVLTNMQMRAQNLYQLTIVQRSF